MVPRAAVPLLLAACTAAPGSPDSAPTAIDLRPQFLARGLPPRHQGGRPTCSIFTTVAAIEYALAAGTGTGVRLSVDYANWAANAATGRTCDGDFFSHALTGFARFGVCRDELLPYAGRFDPAAVPPPDALVDGGRCLAACEGRLRIRWLRANDGTRGLDEPQFAAVLQCLADGWPVAAGSAHSRLLIGYRTDAAAPGGGVFTTLDSGLGAFGEASAAFVRSETCDAFVVTWGPAEAAARQS